MMYGTISCAVMAFVVLFVSPFLIGYSFDVLRPTSMAFLYNANTLDLKTDRVYNSAPGLGGRFYTGLGQEFKWLFPRKELTLRFADTEDSHSRIITGLTVEGAQVEVGMSFQYSLPTTPKELADLFEKFELQYESFFIMFVRAIARDVISETEVTDMYQNRTLFAARLEAEIRDHLHTNFGCTVHRLQVLNVDIPVTLQEAIENTTVLFQGIEEARFNQIAETVLAETKRLTAEQDALITVLDANATAASTLLGAEADATALEVSVSAESASLKAASSSLGLTGDNLLAYAWLQSVDSAQAKRKLINIKPSASTTD